MEFYVFFEGGFFFSGLVLNLGGREGAVWRDGEERRGEGGFFLVWGRRTGGKWVFF